MNGLIFSAIVVSLVAVLGAELAFADQLNNPGRLIINSTHIIVADTDNFLIQVFDKSGNFVGKFGDGLNDSDDDSFTEPVGLAIDGTNILVGDGGSNDRVITFDRFGTFISEFGSSGTGNGQFDNPRDIAINSTNIIVVDTSRHRIQVFDKSANHERTFGSSGSGNLQFSFPRAIALNGTNIIISDTVNDRIQVFDTSMNYVSTIGSGQVNNPGSLAFNSTHLLVADYFNSRIAIYHMNNGSFAGAFGGDLNGDGDENDNGELINPSGVAIDNENIFVSEIGNDRVQIFDLSGNYQNKFSGIVCSGNESIVDGVCTLVCAPNLSKVGGICTDVPPTVVSGSVSITENTAQPGTHYSNSTDTVALSFTASEEITPVVTFPSLGSATVTYANPTGNQWVATAATSDATEGPVTFTINFRDTTGNALATPKTTTDDSSSVTVDLTPLELLTLTINEGQADGGTDYSKVGSSLNLYLVVPSVETIQHGSTISIGQSTDQLVSALPGFGASVSYTLTSSDDESENFPFTYTLVDRAGNESIFTEADITDGSKIVFDKTAPTFQSAKIVGAGDLVITYSEPVISTTASHYTIEWPDGGGTDTVRLVFGSGTNTILVTIDNTDPEGNDLVDLAITNGVTDLAGNGLTAIALESNKISADFVQPALSTTDDYLFISEKTLITNIDATTVSPKLDISGLLADGNTDEANFPASAITLRTEDATIIFPASLEMRGLTDKVIEVSVSTRSADLPGPVIGEIIEIGDPNDDSITLSNPVSITLLGHAGNTPFTVTSAGTFIIPDCTSGSASVAPDLTELSTTDPALDTSHCHVESGEDIVIWTRHFTGFGSHAIQARGGGSSGDSDPPSASIGFANDEYPLTFDGKNYSYSEFDSVHTATIGKQGTLDVTLRLYDNEGAANVSHVDLYVNHDGSRILNDLSETVVTYDKSSGVIIMDPHDLINTANVTSSTSKNKAVFDFVITFEDIIPKSDVLIRTWDNSQNSALFHLVDALTVSAASSKTIASSDSPQITTAPSDSSSKATTTDDDSSQTAVTTDDSTNTTTPADPEPMPTITPEPKDDTDDMMMQDDMMMPKDTDMMQEDMDADKKDMDMMMPKDMDADTKDMDMMQEEPKCGPGTMLKDGTCVVANTETESPEPATSEEPQGILEAITSWFRSIFG